MGLSGAIGRLFARRPTRKQRRHLKRVLQAEAIATSEGLMAFEDHKSEFERSSALLRRNVHRLEKGLCMPERKAVFGTKFITETVELFERIAHSADGEPGERKWAHDVLHRYFDVVDTEPDVIAKAQKDFQRACTNIATISGDATFAPYAVKDLPAYVGRGQNELVSHDAFQALCRARRSQRWFADETVPRSVVEAAVETALQAPSACNRQPFDYYYSDNPDVVSRIAALPLGTAGFGDDLPGIIAVIGNLSAYSEPRDRHLIYIDAALSSMQLMLGMTSQGYGSVPINWPDIPKNHQALRDILGLKSHQVPIMLIGVGHPKPDARIAYSAKRPVAEALHVVP